ILAAVCRSTRMVTQNPIEWAIYLTQVTTMGCGFGYRSPALEWALVACTGAITRRPTAWHPQNATAGVRTRPTPPRAAAGAVSGHSFAGSGHQQTQDLGVT